MGKFFTCKQCGIEKELQKFESCKEVRRGHRAICKACVYETRRKKYFETHTPRVKNIDILLINGIKVCSDCGNEKSLDEFYFRADRNQYDGRCRSCKKKHSKGYHEANREIILSKAKLYRDKNRKELNEKANEYYNENKEIILPKQREYHRENKEARNKVSKQYQEKNKERLKLKSKEWREKNAEKIKADKKEYYEENKYKILKRGGQNKKLRLQSDPQYKLKENMSTLFRNSLRFAGIRKQGAAFAYTGISWDSYIDHLKADPLWSEYVNRTQKLSVDHIIPCALFDQSDPDEIAKCWNPRNLRLLPSTENIVKSKKFLPELVIQYGIEDLLPKGLNMS